MVQRLAQAAAITAASLLATASLAATARAPVIGENDLVAELRMPPGRYCAAKPVFADDGSVESVALGQCFTALFEKGRLDLEADAKPDGRPGAMIASLGRGAYLLQSDEGEGFYLLKLAIIRESGVAMLPEPALALGGFAGTPDGLGRLRDAVGLWFDRALRKPERARMLTDEAAYLVRAEEGAAPEAVKAEVEKLRDAIMRAMILE